MERTISFKCSECDQKNHYIYSNRKEAVELQKRYGNGKFKCSRHSKPEEVLSLSRLKTEKIFTVQIHESLKEGFFNGTNGFICGPGFKAWSKDFPIRTKIIVTAKVLLP